MTPKPPMSKQERLIRIELVKARARLERANIYYRFTEMQKQCTVAGIWASLRGKQHGSGKTGVLQTAFRVPFRYSGLVLHSAPSLFTWLSRRQATIRRMALLGLLAWHVVATSSKKSTGPDHPISRQSGD